MPPATTQRAAAMRSTRRRGYRSNPICPPCHPRPNVQTRVSTKYWKNKAPRAWRALLVAQDGRGAVAAAGSDGETPRCHGEAVDVARHRQMGFVLGVGMLEDRNVLAHAAGQERDVPNDRALPIATLQASGLEHAVAGRDGDPHERFREVRPREHERHFEVVAASRVPFLGRRIPEARGEPARRTVIVDDRAGRLRAPELVVAALP